MSNKKNETSNTDSTVPVRHIVAFKFVDGITNEEIAMVESAFRALKKKIPQVVSIEESANINPEKLDQGFQRTWLVSFKDLADRDIYLPHPAHEKFKEFAGQFLAEPFVYDILDESMNRHALLADDLYALIDAVVSEDNLGNHKDDIQAALEDAFDNHNVNFACLVALVNEWLPKFKSQYCLSLGAEKQECYETAAGRQCDYSYELMRLKTGNTVCLDSIVVDYSTLDDSD